MTPVYRRTAASRRLLALIALLPAALPGQTTFTWTGAPDGAWNTDGNWDQPGLPAPLDDVVVNGSGSAYLGAFTATIGSASIGYLTGGSLTIGSDGSLTISNALDIGCGCAGGTVIVQAGGTGSSGSLNVNANSQFTVTGVDSAWAVSGQTSVGDNATVSIGSHGSWTTAGFTVDLAGSVTVSDAGSSWTGGDGSIGTGSITIQGGATATLGGVDVGQSPGDVATLTVKGGSVLATGDVIQGSSADAVGTATVADEDSLWTVSGDLTVGQAADATASLTVSATASVAVSGLLLVGFDGSHGSLTVESGATLSSGEGRIGDFGASQGEVLVTGSGSSWDVTGNLTVGYQGTGATGSLTVAAGGTGSSESLTIGYVDDATGEMTVTGSGSSWTTGDLRVGDQGGTGTLTVEDGAAFASGTEDFPASAYIGYGSDGSMTIQTGATWTQHGSTGVGEGAHGTLNILSGGVATVDDLLIGGSNGGHGTATVSGTGSELNALLIGIGTPDGATPGGDTSTLTIASGGTVNVDAYMVIFADGRLNLGDGTLNAGAIINSGTIAVTGAATGINSYLLITGGTLDLTAATSATFALPAVEGFGTIALDDQQLVLGDSSYTEFAGSITGNAGSIRKVGSGGVALTGDNTFKGGVLVSDGILVLAGNNRGALGDIEVAGGLLIAAGGANTLGVGTLPLGHLTLSGGDLELASNQGRNYRRDTTVSADATIAISRSGARQGNATITHSLGALSIGSQTLTVAHGNAIDFNETAGLTFGAVTLTGAATFAPDAFTRLTLASVTGTNRGFTVAGNGETVVSGAINTGTGTLVKNDGGTLILNGASTYSGATTVNAGTLRANNLTGSATGTGPVTVHDGAVLGGGGFIGGPVTLLANAILAPGNSPGTITFTNGLALDAGSILDFELGSTSDLIRVTGGTLSGPLSGTITVNISDSGGLTTGLYTLIDASGATLTSIAGTSFAVGTGVGGYAYSFGRTGDLLQLTVSAIPEPGAAAALAALAGAGFVALRRRRRAG